MRTVLPPAFLLAAAAILAGCDAGQGGTRFQLAIADGPVDDAEAVILSIAGVELQFADGEKRLFPFEPPREVDVLAASGGRSIVLLDEEGTPASTYVALRLLLPVDSGERASVVRLRNGSEHPLVVPAEARDALAVRAPLIVAAGALNAYTLHLDLRRSLLPPTGSGKPYRLHPVLHLVRNGDAGAVSGTIASNLIRSDCHPAVYVFQGAQGGLDDVDGDALEPYASARVPLDGGTYAYTVAFLPAGDYRIAFTCDAGRDDPLRDDRLGFVPTTGVPLQVEPQKTLVVNLGEASNPTECPEKVEASGRKPDKPRKPRPDKPKPDKPKPDKPKPDKPKPDKPKPDKPKPDEPGDRGPGDGGGPPREEDRDDDQGRPSPGDDESGDDDC